MKKILIVDDSEDIHELCSVLIRSKKKVSFLTDFFFDLEFEESHSEKTNFKVMHAYQGEEAIQMIIRASEEQEPFDLVFIDVNMPPGIDGVETIIRVSKKISEMKFVVCSAFMNREWDEIRKSIDHSVTLYPLRKPFTSKKIHKVLNEVLK